MIFRTRTLTIALAAALSLGLSGCGLAGGIISGLGGEKTSSSPSPSPKSPSPSPSTSGGTPNSPSPSPGGGGGATVTGWEAKFGDTLRTPDGLIFTVSKPVPYTPSDTSAGHEAGTTGLKFDVTLRNETGKPYDCFDMLANLYENDKKTEQIFDGAKVTDPPAKAMANNTEAKFSLAFGVRTQTGLVLKIAPDFMEDPEVIFRQ